MTKRVAADVVVGFDPLDHVDRKGQLGQPGGSGSLVGQVELGGRGVLDAGFGAQVVLDRDEQVRFLATHQINVAHRPVGGAGQGRRPDQASRAVAEQVGDHDG